MIDITLRLDNASNRGARGKAWIGETTIDGQQFSAKSHSGASYALSRVLVNADIPDQPVRLRQVGLAGHITFKSLHKMAGKTISESTMHPISAATWREMDMAVAA